MQATQDKIFSAKISTISKKALVDAFAVEEAPHPLGQLWTDSSGKQWSPVGRIAWLWLTSSEHAHPSNFATAVELLKETAQAGNAWHESFEGVPDVALLWLAHFRATSAHTQLENRMAGLLHSPTAPVPMRAGVEGDGGWLDRAFSFLRQAVHQSPDPNKAILIPVAELVYSKLLRCNLQAMESSYGVWGCPTSLEWGVRDGTNVFDRLVRDMNEAGVYPVSVLNSYMLLSACSDRFFKQPTPVIREIAPQWLPRMVEYAVEEQDRPYRFPSSLAAQILSWPGVEFPECMSKIGGLSETMAHVVRSEPGLASVIEQHYLEREVSSAPRPVHSGMRL